MPTDQVRIYPRARHDMGESFLYLAAEADINVATRFFDAAHATFRSLLLTPPNIGRKRMTLSKELGDIRQVAIIGFKNYIVIYRVVPSGIDIIRILQGARDIDTILHNEGLD